MTTRGRYPVNYRALAHHLSGLDTHAPCVDMAAALAAYADCDEGLRGRMLAAMVADGSQGSWYGGILAICRVLEEQNPRFLTELFLDWCEEGR